MNRLKFLIIFCFLTYVRANAQFVLNGSAFEINDSCYQLTGDQEWIVGSIWNANKVNLNTSFEVAVDLFFGSKDLEGADGIVFGLQPISTSIGVAGGDIGFGGVTPSLGVEFDTYQNINFDDPEFDHIAIIRDGILMHNMPNGALAGPVQADSDEENIEDGVYHEIRISWNAERQELSVIFDCELRLSYQGDVVNNIFNGEPEVFWGLTSATGGLSNIQEVCFSYTTFLDGLEDVSICRGSSVQLEATGGVSYQWTPAIGLSDPNIPNPIASPIISTEYQVEIIDDCGLTFRDELWVELKDEQRGVFMIPNIFSPNGDGINDLFELIVEDEEAEVQNYNCKIYNRWGQLVFESSVPSVSWDGTNTGKDAISDVYVYIMEFELDNCSFTEKGDVTLYR